MRPRFASSLLAGLALSAGTSVAAQSDDNFVLVNDRDSAVAQAVADTRRVAWVDLDADGLLDWFALNYDMPSEACLNAGDGSFVPVVDDDNALLAARKAKGVAFFDVDGDGAVDAYIAVGNDRPNVFLRNTSLDPDGVPGRFVVWDFGLDDDARHSYDAAFGDLDGDGLADLVVANRYQRDDLYVQRLESGDAPDGEWSEVSSIVEARMRLDNKKAQGWKAALWDDGIVDQGPNMTPATNPWESGEARDFVVTYHRASGLVTFWAEGLTGGEVLRSLMPTDGDLDLAGLRLAARVEPGCTVRLHDMSLATTENVRRMDDMLHDGADGTFMERDELFRAGGAIGFALTGKVTMTWEKPQKGDRVKAMVYVLQGRHGEPAEPVRSFTRRDDTSVSERSLGSRDVELFDADDDGDLDVLIAYSTDDDNGLHVNQGGLQGGVQGLFEELTHDPLVTSRGKTYGLAVGDLDGDGLLDVMVANRDQVNEVYENVSDALGNGPAFRLMEGSVIDADVADSYDVAFGDLEGDGDVDIVVVNREMQNVVYLARTDDPFADPASAYTKVVDGPIVEDVGNSRSVALADVHDYLDPLLGVPVEDALEIAMANTVGESNWLYQAFGPSWAAYAVDDGSVGEAAFEGHGTPRPGERLVLRIEGLAPDAEVGLLLGLAPDDTELPFGRLLVDLTPGLGFFVPGLAADGSGVLEVTLDVPHDDALEPGLAAWFQVLSRKGPGHPKELSHGLKATLMPAR